MTSLLVEFLTDPKPYQEYVIDAEHGTDAEKRLVEITGLMWVAYVRNTQSINIAKLTPKKIEPYIEYFVVRSNFTDDTTLLLVRTEDQNNKFYSPKQLSNDHLQLFVLNDLKALNLMIRGDI